jgi:hypothetical protein
MTLQVSLREIKVNFIEMRQKNRTNPNQNEEITLIDRALTAVVAPIIFNISILLIASQIFGKSLRLGVYHRTSWLSDPIFLIGCLLLPILLGFILGSSAFATLLGHFFYTNHESKRSPKKTVTVWIVLFSLAYLLSKI